jgi:peptide/nickel transport system permease protein
VLVSAAFGIAQVVLIESSLEFLRVSVASSVSWGEMLSEARGHPGAYWLLLFPGLAIFVVVAGLNLVGEAWRDALDPRLAHSRL